MAEHIRDLTNDPRNARRHNPRNIGMIESALREVGAARSIVVDEDGVILAGNATVEAAAAAGIERVITVDADGETIVAVRRTGLTPAQKTRLALFDNRTAELADWDTDVLASLSDEVELSGMFFDDELAAALAGTQDAFLSDALGAGDGRSPWPESDDGESGNTLTLSVTPSERDTIMRAVKLARQRDHEATSTPLALVVICEAYVCQHTS